MVGITLAQVLGTFIVAQSLGYLLFTFSPTQHRGPNKCDGRIYPDPFWSCTSQPNDVTDRIWDYDVEVQRSSAQFQPKRKELIFGKVQTGKPQKGRSWYLRSTNGQTPKRKELIFDNSIDEQISEWKELIFNKGTDEQSHSIRKEPMRTTLVGKGKN